MHESGSGCLLFLFSFNFSGREIEVQMENYVLVLVSVLILSYAADKGGIRCDCSVGHLYDIKLVFDVLDRKSVV